MNFRYYKRIYLNNKLHPIDFSLLDNKDWIRNEDKYQDNELLLIDSTRIIRSNPDSAGHVISINLGFDTTKKNWLKIESEIVPESGTYGSYLNSEIQNGDDIKHNKIRLFGPSGYYHQYAFYVNVPDWANDGKLMIYVSSVEEFYGNIKTLKITALTR